MNLSKIKLAALKVEPSDRHLAKNSKSNHILERLSDNHDWYIRLCVADNKNCTESILKKLSTDEYTDIAISAKTKLISRNFQGYSYEVKNE